MSRCTAKRLYSSQRIYSPQPKMLLCSSRYCSCTTSSSLSISSHSGCGFQSIFLFQDVVHGLTKLFVHILIGSKNPGFLAVCMLDCNTGKISRWMWSANCWFTLEHKSLTIFSRSSIMMVSSALAMPSLPNREDTICCLLALSMPTLSFK